MSRRIDIPPTAKWIDLLHRRRWQLALAAVWSTLAALHGSAAHATTAAAPLEFRSGNPKMATMLARLNATRELAAEPFSVAVVDLNGDGQNEIIVRSDGRGFCGAGGCLTVVLEQQGPKMVTLLSQNLFPGLGVTNEKVGAYRALAALDSSGVIVTGDKPGTPLFGKPLVYPMQVATAPGPQPAAPRVQADASAKRDATGGPPRPEMLGMTVGVASLPDARAALAALTPPLTVREHTTQLVGRSTADRGMSQQVQVQNGLYVSQLQAHTQAFRPNCQNFVAQMSPTDCDDIVVHLSSPPQAGVVLGVTRKLRFRSGPAVDTVVQSLIQKYGKPGLQWVYGNNVQFNLHWAWTKDGTSLPLTRGHACAHPYAAQIVGDLNRWLSQAENLLRERCAIVLHVTLGAANHVVSGMDMAMTDQALVRDTSTRTVELVTGHVKGVEQGERDKAAKTAAPKF